MEFYPMALASTLVLEPFLPEAISVDGLVAVPSLGKIGEWGGWWELSMSPWFARKSMGFLIAHG